MESESRRMRLPEIEIDIYALDAIIQNSYDGIFITDGQAVTIMVNRSYETISGLRAEQVLGRSMREIVEEGLISASGTLLALEKRRPVTLDQQFRNGNRAMITSSPILAENGRVAMVVTNVRDITEICRLQEELERNEEKKRRSTSEAEALRRQLMGNEDLIVADRNMQNVLRMVSRVARLDTTVLLLGETGVGKEEVAKHLYRTSSRSDKQFIKVNCGAIPAELIESCLLYTSVFKVVPHLAQHIGAEKEQKIDQRGDDDGPGLPGAEDQLKSEQYPVRDGQPFNFDRDKEEEQNLHVGVNRGKGEKQGEVEVAVGRAAGDEAGDDGADHAHQVIDGKAEAAPLVLQAGAD